MATKRGSQVYAIIRCFTWKKEHIAKMLQIGKNPSSHVLPYSLRQSYLPHFLITLWVFKGATVDRCACRGKKRTWRSAYNDPLVLQPGQVRFYGNRHLIHIYTHAILQNVTRPKKNQYVNVRQCLIQPSQNKKQKHIMKQCKTLISCSRGSKPRVRRAFTPLSPHKSWDLLTFMSKLVASYPASTHVRITRPEAPKTSRQSHTWFTVRSVTSRNSCNSWT